MAQKNLYLPEALEELLELEAAAAGLEPGRFATRVLASALTGSPTSALPSTASTRSARIVSVLRAAGKAIPVAEVAQLSGVTEDDTREILRHLLKLRFDGARKGLVELGDEAGSAVWRIAA